MKPFNPIIRSTRATILALLAFTASVQAGVRDSIDEGEAVLQQQEQDVLSSNEYADGKKRITLLKKLKIARKGYREWKRFNPDYKVSLREMKKVARLIKSPGTPEHEAMRLTQETCIKEPDACERTLKVNASSIFSAHLASLEKLNQPTVTTWMTKAYAHGSRNVRSCYNKRGNDGKLSGPDASFYAVILGEDACGIRFYGPGLGYNISAHALVCGSGSDGLNIGPYASVSGLIGVGAGILVGENGVCTLLTAHVIGVGAFGGIAVVEGFGEDIGQ